MRPLVSYSLQTLAKLPDMRALLRTGPQYRLSTAVFEPALQLEVDAEKGFRGSNWDNSSERRKPRQREKYIFGTVRG